MLALASPASLKGVLTPLEAAAFLAEGMRRVDGVDVIEAPVADGGEGTAAVIGGRARRRVAQRRRRGAAGCAGRGAPGWSLADGTAVVDSAQAVGLPLFLAPSAIPSGRRLTGSAICCSPCARRARRRMLVGVGGHGDGRRWSRDAGASSARAARHADSCGSVTCAARCSAVAARRACSGRRKEPTPRRWSSSRRRLAATRRACAVPRPARCRGRRRTRRRSRSARRRARSRGRARPRPDRASTRTQRGADLVVTGEGGGRRDDLRGQGCRAPCSRDARRLGVRCELFGGIVAPGFDAHALSGRPRASRRRISWRSGELPGQPGSPAERASSSIDPRTPSSFAAQSR